MLNSRKLNAKKTITRKNLRRVAIEGGISVAVLYQEKTEGKIGEHK